MRFQSLSLSNMGGVSDHVPTKSPGNWLGLDFETLHAKCTLEGNNQCKFSIEHEYHPDFDDESGMKKHRYGNIEDIVQNITLITPKGTINQIKPLTRSSVGVKAQNMIFGSEGNFGIITKATIRIHKKPEASTFESILFQWRQCLS